MAVDSGNFNLDVAEITTNVATTNNVVTGDGIFDDLMETVTKHIEAQYQAGRIKGEMYANVYLGAMQTVLQQAVAFAMQRKLLDQQGETEAAKTDLIKQQVLTEAQKTELVERQREGFDDDAKQKLLKTALDTWSVAFSAASVQSDIAIPNTIVKTTIDNLVKNLFDNYEIPVTITNIEPLGEYKK